MDVAASEFYKDGKYDLDFKNPKSNPEDWISSEKLCEMYHGFIKDAPVISIEDPFDQVHFEFPTDRGLTRGLFFVLFQERARGC